MLEQILKGGAMMVPLMALSLLGVAVVFDRWMAFSANRKVDTKALRAKVQAALRAQDTAAAIAACEGSSGPIASVLLAGLRTYVQLCGKNENPETMRLVVGQVMEDYSAQAISVVNKRMDVLTTVGTAAPLFGMTGTVTGMIVSFKGLASAGSMGGGGAVADGIAEALITTAAGLIIALMAVIPQSLFNRWSDEIELEIEEATAEMVEFILTHH